MPADAPGTFGRRLRELRESVALSQEELAARANLTAKAIGALERGERRRPYPNTVRAICDALDLADEDRTALAAAARPETDPNRGQRSTSPVPVPSSPMVGREAEVARLVELLGSGEHRVVTLTGPGGVGKTRVAWEVARALAADGCDVAVVELAEVRRVELVLPTIARALGRLAASDDVMESIASLVAGRNLVLVLDNVEHLLGAAADIAELVRRCEHLVVLATSRAPLRIRAEHELPLGPLPLPTDDHDLRAVASSAAAQMFADRARSIVPTFEIDQENASAVAAICGRLDGLPLALELAAAHVRYLDAEQLLDRVDHAIDTERLRDLPERQRTMKATLDWSYDLLTTDEQDLLRSLSAFVGGFDLAAADQVGAAAGREVLPALEGLVEQSLAVPDGSGASRGRGRFRMLEPVRDYAAALMSEAEAATVTDRHCSYFVALADDARTGLRTLEVPIWLDRLDRDHANLRAALTWMLEQGSLDRAARLGASTWLYWALRGHAAEGLVWWQRVLDEDRGRLDDRGRASASLTLAGLRLATGDGASACDLATIAASCARSADDDALLGEALVLASMGATFTGELATTAEHLDELFGVCAALDSAWVSAHAYISQAQLALVQGDFDASVRGLDIAEELARAEAGAFTLATALNVRTTLAQQLGDDDTALNSAVEAAELASEVGTTWTLVYTLSALAVQAVRQGRAELATTLFAAGAAMAETSLLAVAFPPDLHAAEAHLGEVRLQLSDDEFARAWARGRTLGVDDVPSLIPEITEDRAPR